jgi:hypothetical protein
MHIEDLLLGCSSVLTGITGGLSHGSLMYRSTSVGFKNGFADKLVIMDICMSVLASESHTRQPASLSYVSSETTKSQIKVLE